MSDDAIFLLLFILGAGEIYSYWSLVDVADGAEVSSFVEHNVFSLSAWKDEEVDNVVDGIWVRRWKDRAQKLLKTRLCGRGYLDRQKKQIDRHSSTVSQLSRLIGFGTDCSMQLTDACFGYQYNFS